MTHEAPRATNRWVILAAGLLLPVGLGACQRGVLDPQGPVAAAERVILLNATAIMLAVVVPVIAMTFAFAWWFRAGNPRARRRPDWSYSGRLEFLVWSIPAMVVLFLGGIAWVGSHDLEPSKPLVSEVPPLEVEVVALDWQWLFIYPREGVASLNQLVIPAATPISFRLTSTGVMNSFFVPQLGSQIYAMAGMTTRLHLQADRPGTYPGLAAHYNGAGFSDMDFETVALPAEAFAGWVERAKAAGGGTLDAARFAEFLRPTPVTGPPTTFAATAPGLFDAIVGGVAASAAGPAPAPEVHSARRGQQLGPMRPMEEH